MITPMQNMIDSIQYTMDKYRDNELFHDELVGLKVFAMLLEQDEKQIIIDAVDGHPIHLRDLDGTSYYTEAFKPEEIL